MFENVWGFPIQNYKRFEALEIGPDLASSQNWANPDLTSSRFYRLAITKNPIGEKRVLLRDFEGGIEESIEYTPYQYQYTV